MSLTVGYRSWRLSATSLRDRGLPLWRISFSLLAKHPEVRWRTVRWHETQGTAGLERVHDLSREALLSRRQPGRPTRFGGRAHSSTTRRLRLEVPHLPRARRAAGAPTTTRRGCPSPTAEASYVAWAYPAPQRLRRGRITRARRHAARPRAAHRARVGVLRNALAARGVPRQERGPSRRPRAVQTWQRRTNPRGHLVLRHARLHAPFGQDSAREGRPDPGLAISIASRGLSPSTAARS